jgi:hypothetical protein
MEWRDIPGYEGRYQVSDTGGVRSLDRTIEAKNRWGFVGVKRLRGRELKLHKYPNDYIGVMLGAGSHELVHRLVACAFIPGDTSLQVNHKNGVRGDNRRENLEWLTCTDNHLHSYRELGRKKHGKTEATVLMKECSVLRFESALAAASYLGVVAGSVASAAVRGHKCRGYRVMYD